LLSIILNGGISDTDRTQEVSLHPKVGYGMKFMVWGSNSNEQAGGNGSAMRYPGGFAFNDLNLWVLRSRAAPR